MGYTERAIGIAARLHAHQATSYEITRKNEESTADLGQFDDDAPLILTPAMFAIPVECVCRTACARLGLCPGAWCGRALTSEEGRAA